MLLIGVSDVALHMQWRSANASDRDVPSHFNWDIPYVPTAGTNFIVNRSATDNTKVHIRPGSLLSYSNWR